MEFKRRTLFAGHYGSGKTNIAVNYALRLRSEGRQVMLADLDIVNPYFRTRDSEELLRQNGIGLICSAYANSNVDLPAMPKEVYSLLADRESYSVLDIGGDDRGALALGRYRPQLLEEDDYEMAFVVNCYRPLTATPEAVLEVMQEIRQACELPFTTVVNNSNLGLETKAEDVLNSMSYAERISELSGLPLKMTCCAEHLEPMLRGKIPDLFPLSIQKLYYMINSEVTNGKTDI